MSAAPFTLLGVWAHPDDEAYLSAGLMARTVDAGGRVVVVTATAGERGTPDPARWPPDRLAALRREELRTSLSALGVEEHIVLGFPDGGCHLLDAAWLVAGIIEDVRPDLVVSFGLDGMTGHADHRAVAAWTERAWRSSGSPGELWQATLTPSFHDEWDTLNRDVGLWADQPHPPSTPVEQLAHATELDEELLDRKMAALRAHASQTTPLIDLVGADVYRRWWREEAFVAAAPVTTAPPPARHERGRAHPPTRRGRLLRRAGLRRG